MEGFTGNEILLTDTLNKCKEDLELSERNREILLELASGFENELDTLRKSLAEVTQERDSHAKEISMWAKRSSETEAERDRLRDALEEIRDNKPLVDNDIQCNLTRPYGWMSEYEHLKDIARKELEASE